MEKVVQLILGIVTMSIIVWASIMAREIEALKLTVGSLERDIHEHYDVIKLQQEALEKIADILEDHHRAIIVLEARRSYTSTLSPRD